MKEINVIAFTENACKVAGKIKEKLNTYSVNCYLKSSGNDAEGFEKVTESIEEFAGKSFKNNTPLIVVGAMGIATRMIAPFVKNKLTDIPVIVIDELATFVIPVLSGHVGGANELSLLIANVLSAVPVITTATDINDKFSIDIYATKHNLTIVNKEGIKRVSKKILEDKPLVVTVKDYPPKGPVDIAITDACDECNAELYLRPKKYTIGIGTRRGKSFAELREFVEEILTENNIPEADIAVIASIDNKKDEEGIIKLAGLFRVPFITYEAEILDKVTGDFNRSEFVKQTVGVDNVCEKSAILSAGSGSKLVVEKTTHNGMSLAVARINN